MTDYRPVSTGLEKTLYFFGGMIGLTLPQSDPSHLPEPSMFIFSGLPSTTVLMAIFML
jgi:hypothetical protein